MYQLLAKIYNVLFYQPILNLLIFIYNTLPIKDMGIAIILITVIIRLILWPVTKKQLQAQKAFKEIQPKIAEINKKYKDDFQQRQAETMKLYKEHKANPAASCLPVLIQFPILIAMFQVFRDGLSTKALTALYPFVTKPEVIDKLFLNISYFDLSSPNIVLAAITAFVQFWQTKMFSTNAPIPISSSSENKNQEKEATKDENMQAALNKQMLYMMPILTLVFGVGIPEFIPIVPTIQGLPSGLMLYWLFSTLLMGLQQWWEFKDNSKIKMKM